MIDLQLLKYSLAALLLLSAAVFVGFLPMVYAWQARRSTETVTVLEASVAALIGAIVYFSLTGVLMVQLPVGMRRMVADVIILLPMIAGGVLLWRRRPAWPAGFWRRKDLVLIVGTFLFSVLILLLAALKINMPANLPDGAYVNKEHVSAVRIQVLTGDLPADNVIPFVVQEYLARSISFSRNNPVLPGQQVTNRPILASLIGLPFRLSLRPVQPMADLPKYSYVGSDWPDFRVLVRDEAAFAVFLGIAVFLNASVLMGAGLFLTRIKRISARHCGLAVLLFATSPYFVFQTIFTWPKALAGFFILAAAFQYLVYRRAVLAGALLGLAYWSHPYAIGYFIIAVALLGLSLRVPFRQRAQRIVLLTGAFGAVLTPWFVWAKYVIGSSSDLVQQNFNTDGTMFAFSMARLGNLVNATLPTHLMVASTNAPALLSSSALNFSGAVGLLFFITMIVTHRASVPSVGPGSSAVLTHDPAERQLRRAAMYAGMASFLLTLVFSYAAVPLVHGWQPFVALMLMLGVVWASQSGAAALAVCALQVAVNLVLWQRFMAFRLHA